MWLLLLAHAVSAYDNNAPFSRLPTLGWSSWVALGPGAEHPVFDFCDEASVKASADAFVALGLYDVGYRHFHLDDCWAGGRNSTGFLYPEKDHFPNGMKPVVDYVHSKGLVFGLYTCAGTQTCVGGRPGSKGHWEQDAAVWAEWGVDWVKMDWCNTQGMEPKTTYPNMSEALNKTGRPIHFNMCEWGVDDPWTWGQPIAQSWRMGGDHTGIWSSTKDVIQSVAKIPVHWTGVPYGWNDMDMLETGCYEQCAHANGKQANMTETEYITEFSMWAISASPLQFTSPLMNCSNATGPVVCKPWISDLQKKILLNTEVIGINQDVTPQGAPLSGYGLTVWARALSNGGVAVAFYNEDDKAASISVRFKDLPTQFTKAKARDLWAHADLGVFDGSYPQTGGVSVDAHATHVVLLTQA